MKEAKPTIDEFFGELNLYRIAIDGNNEEDGETLCRFVELSGCRCDDCPFTGFCIKYGINGAVAYLQKLYSEAVRNGDA